MYEDKTSPQGFSFFPMFAFLTAFFASSTYPSPSSNSAVSIHSSVQQTAPHPPPLQPMKNNLQRDARKREKENTVTPVACLFALLCSSLVRPAPRLFKDKKQKKKNYTSTSIHTCSAYVCVWVAAAWYCMCLVFGAPFQVSPLVLDFAFQAARQEKFFPYKRIMTTTHTTFLLF